MKRGDPYLLASLQGEQVIRERGISAFPVDPVGIACDLDIEVVAKQAHAAGVSGMLMRVGNSSCGFRRASRLRGFRAYAWRRVRG